MVSGDRVCPGGKERQPGLLPVALECTVLAPHILADQEAGRMTPEVEKMEQEVGHDVTQRPRHSERRQGFFPRVVYKAGQITN